MDKEKHIYMVSYKLGICEQLYQTFCHRKQECTNKEVLRLDKENHVKWQMRNTILSDIKHNVSHVKCIAIIE